MTRPRRSQQMRSPRPRACRATSRGLVAEGRTHLLHVTAADRDWNRQSRLARAEAAHVQAEADLDEATDALLAATEIHVGFTRRSADLHERTCDLRLARADAELKAAQRNASRPVGDLVTPPLVSLPQPRTWPNAAPGGTSPRRATRALLRLADSEQVDLVRMPGDPSAYTARMVDIRARAKTVQFGLEYPTRA